MQSLEAETGVNTGWINNGGLFVAKTTVRLDEYKRLHTVRCIKHLSLPHPPPSLCICAGVGKKIMI